MRNEPKLNFAINKIGKALDFLAEIQPDNIDDNDEYWGTIAHYLEGQCMNIREAITERRYDMEGQEV